MSQTHAMRGRDSAQEVARAATDAQFPPPNSFTIPPSQAVVDAFDQHVRETGEPDTFPSITTTTRPKNSPVRFIRRLPTIDRKKRRDGQEAPCPICSPKSPKYIKNGILAWYPEERAIRAIGPECGDRIFGGQYAIALADLKKREREEWLVEFLRLNLPKQVSILTALNALEEPAREAQRLYKHLRDRGPRIHAKLRDIKKRGGALTVTIVRERRDKADDKDVRDIGPRGIATRESEYDSFDELFGRLPETTALNKDFDPVGDLRKCRDSLLELPQLVSGDEAFLWACDQSEDLKRLTEPVNKLNGCAHGYMKLASRLDSFIAFFDSSLFGMLDRWGSHPENDFQLSASANGGTFRLEYVAKWYDREVVVLRPDFEKLGKRSQLPGFEQP